MYYYIGHPYSMAAVSTQTMYSSSSQSDASPGYAYYEHRPSYSGSLSRSHSYGRPTIELPRPLEPRPALHTSLSESSGGSRSHDVSHGPLSPDQRSQGQNLPALRDIFSPGLRASLWSSLEHLVINSSSSGSVVGLFWLVYWLIQWSVLIVLGWSHRWACWVGFHQWPIICSYDLWCIFILSAVLCWVKGSLETEHCLEQFSLFPM